ncbi:unnamed protein product [Rotaria sp. Silwood1]|nr:unnamed protein product [Rotaria sp. Silwood1]CAF3905461.1 unnamed protein product [Rotaria sp. Silwood1]CAF3919671.1 unnamed protein product [Rotaria sp. Silwood1]CAF4700010.1 unnamed protein product [Rotaria sp. Silwood1]CAF4727368.1 unnamed protein product [Rotaria sp. Silwood1]
MASRIIQTTRNTTEQQEDLQQLTTMLINSNYPEKEIRKLIQESLKTANSTSTTTTDTDQTPTDMQSKYTITIPYVPGAEVLKRRLEKLQIKVFFSYPNKIKSYFNSNINNETKSIIYRIQCDCNQIYVGETKVGLKARMEQHEKLILEDEHNSNSEIVQHFHKQNYQCLFDTSNAHVIDRDKNWKKRRYKEAIHSIINESINRHDEIDDGWLPILHKKKQEILQRTEIIKKSRTKAAKVEEQDGNNGTEEDEL